MTPEQLVQGISVPLRADAQILIRWCEESGDSMVRTESRGRPGVHMSGGVSEVMSTVWGVPVVCVDVGVARPIVERASPTRP